MSEASRAGRNLPPDLDDVLAAQVALAHRAAMSGMESVLAWSDFLRDPATTPAGMEKRTEMISRLGHATSRLMTSVHRAVTLLERRGQPGR